MGMRRINLMKTILLSIGSNMVLGLLLLMNQATGPVLEPAPAESSVLPLPSTTSESSELPVLPIHVASMPASFERPSGGSISATAVPQYPHRSSGFSPNRPATAGHAGRAPRHPHFPPRRCLCPSGHSPVRSRTGATAPRLESRRPPCVTPGSTSGW